MSVQEAVRRDLERLPEDLARSGWAAVALRIAEDIDDPQTRPAARSMLSKELRENLGVLLAKAPPVKSHDRVDHIKDDLKHRRARRAAS